MTSIHCILIFSSSCAAIIFARSTFHINRGSRKRDRWFMILEQSGDIIIETNIITGYWAARSHASQTKYRTQNIGNQFRSDHESSNIQLKSVPVFIISDKKKNSEFKMKSQKTKKASFFRVMSDVTFATKDNLIVKKIQKKSSGRRIVSNDPILEVKIKEVFKLYSQHSVSVRISVDGINDFSQLLI